MTLFKDKFQNKKAPKNEVSLKDMIRKDETDLESVIIQQNERDEELATMIATSTTECETPTGQTELNPIAADELSIENIFP